VIDFDTLLELCICGRDLVQLFTRERSAILGDCKLAIEIQQVTPVGGKRSDQTDRDRRADKLAFVWQALCQLPGYRSCDPQQLGIDEG